MKIALTTREIVIAAKKKKQTQRTYSKELHKKKPSNTIPVECGHNP
jgi:hypothetical protein